MVHPLARNVFQPSLRDFCGLVRCWEVGRVTPCAPSANTYRHESYADLEFEIWSFSGVWSLELSCHSSQPNFSRLHRNNSPRMRTPTTSKYSANNFQKTIDAK